MKDEIHLAEYDPLIREVLEKGGEFRIYPHGVSMLPLLRQGIDSVSIRRPGKELKKDTIILYQREDDSYVLHRIVGVEPQGFILCGDHQFENEHGVKRERVIGEVTRIFRGEREINPIGYRLYVLLWHSRLVRKVFFRIEKGIKRT